jgi:hypothetical protein
MLCELGFIASRQTKAHEGETTGAITVGGSDATGAGVPVWAAWARPSAVGLDGRL